MQKAMQVKVLGPIGVELDEPAALGGPTQRRVLAVLALHAGEVVSVDRLVDAVWPDDGAPERADHNVRTYVHRLRSALGDDGSRIETVGNGYRMHLERPELDAFRFEDLVAEGRAAAAHDEHDEARRCFDDALALWAGRPYDEFADEEWVRAEVARLDEIRASAVEHRNAALLDAGRHTEVIGELRDAATEQPWREVRRMQLALALYRSGRQAEALQVLRDYRTGLVEELGLDPSPELGRLEHRILEHDPELLPPSHRRHDLRGYRLDEVVGEGAFALVWRGVQPSLGRTVAVKQVRAELANHPDFVRRFETEAQTVAMLEHPYIVPLYDYWREPDGAYLVMRYVSGGSLESEVLLGGLDEAGLRRFVDQAGSALAAAHRMGVIHRDVKAANVLLDDDGNFYLTDFGIAFIGSAADDELATSLSTGSPAYASPEQLRRQALDVRTDVYGFGITLFEAATGRLPFADAPTEAALVRRQLDEPVPAPSSVEPSVPPWVDEVVARATAKNPSDRYASMAELMAAVPPGAGEPIDMSSRFGTATVIGELLNPFKALRAFREADADDFFGRDRLVSRLIEVLSQPGSAGRLLAVVGPSGSGKSSVVRSGLLPRLRRGAVSGSADWFITTMLPGNHPFDEFESALSRVAVRQPGPLVEIMRSDERGIARAVNQILPDEDSELLVVIDQFEELFTHGDDAERVAFVNGLVAAVREPRARLRVVLTIRADFWDRPLRHPGLAARLEKATVTVPPLAADELEAAIVEPVRRQGASYEPGLIARIMADVRDQPGALPLLQYALTELFDTHVSGLIRTESYDAIGGLTGALAMRAEETFTTMSADEQAAARRLFGRLVSLGEGTEDTRRRVRLGELGDDPDTEAVIDAFGDARLLVFDHAPATREPTVELAHEAMIRAWPRLRTWLDEDRDGLRIHRHLTEAATGWLVAGRDPGELYRGGRLEAVEAWAAGHEGDLNAAEHDFLQSSLTERQAELDAEAERFEEQVRHNRRLRGLVAVATVIAVIAAAAGVFALAQRSRANDEAAAAEDLADDAVAAAEEADAATAEADAAAAEADAAAAEADLLRSEAERQALVESARFLSVAAEDAVTDDPDLAVLLAVEAARRQTLAEVDIEEPMRALYTTTSVHDIAFRQQDVGLRFMFQTAVSTEPGGDRAAIVDAEEGRPEDARVDVVDLRTGDRVPVAVDRPTSVAWHASGDEIAIGDDFGVIWSADPGTGEATQLFNAGGDRVNVFSVDDDWLVYKTGEGVGDVVVADTRTFTPVVDRPDSTWALLAPDRRNVVIAGLGDTPFAEVYALPSGELVGSLDFASWDSSRYAWAPDGDSLFVMAPGAARATAQSGVLRRISVPDLDETVQEFPGGPPRLPSTLSVSPDGSRLAVGGTAGEVSVFALDGLELQAQFAGHSAFVASMDWAAGVDQLMTLDRAQQVIGWRLATGGLAPQSTTVGSTKFPQNHVLGPDGTRVVATRNPLDGSVGPVEVWNDDGARVGVPLAAGEQLALGPHRGDEAIVAIVAPGGIRVDDAISGRTVAELPGTLTTPLAISPDGETIVAGNDGPDFSLRLSALSVADGRELWNLPDVSHGGVAFHPDGELLFVPTGPNGPLANVRGPELIVVDSATGEEIASRPLRSGIGNAVVSPLGSFVAVAEQGADDDGAGITVFDVAALLEGRDAVVAETELASGSNPSGIAFSEDESTLFVPEELLGGGLLAMAVDEGLEIRWSLDTGGVVSGLVVVDGLLWFPKPAVADADGVLRFDLVGIPVDLAEYTAWAAKIPRREFTEAECRRYLDGPCADVVSTLSG